MPPARPQPELVSGRKAPSRFELTLIWLLTGVVFFAVLRHFQNYQQQIGGFGDDHNYLQAANAIRHWQISGAEVKQFWGLPYFVAAVSSVGISSRAGLVVVSLLSSLAAVLLAWELWGAWVAGFFTVLSFPWIQLSFLGGAEPLFVALLFASFWAARKQSWVSSTILASLATVVRPLGLFALVGIGLTLLLRRDYAKAMICTGVSLLIGFLYLLPFWIYLHDPLYQFHQYQRVDWHAGIPVCWPFQILIWSFLHHRLPWTNDLFTLVWIAFTLVGGAAMVAQADRSYSRERLRESIPAHFNESLFALLYIAFLFTYNSEWARGEFPRFVIPVIPFLLSTLGDRLPKSRALLYCLAVLSAALGACSVIGIHNVFSAIG